MNGIYYSWLQLIVNKVLVVSCGRGRDQRGWEPGRIARGEEGLRKLEKKVAGGSSSKTVGTRV